MELNIPLSYDWEITEANVTSYDPNVYWITFWHPIQNKSFYKLDLKENRFIDKLPIYMDSWQIALLVDDIERKQNEKR